jgi:antitoxin YefM
MVSLDEYNALTKAAKNAAYLDMVDRSMAQLANGEGKIHELIEVE